MTRLARIFQIASIVLLISSPGIAFADSMTGGSFVPTLLDVVKVAIGTYVASGIEQLKAGYRQTTARVARVELRVGDLETGVVR